MRISDWSSDVCSSDLVRVSGARNPDVIDKFSAVFDSYWNNDDFRPFDEAEFRELTQTPASGPRIYLSPVEIRPEPFQSRLLEQIELSRLQGRSEEHTSELQSLMRHSYAVFGLKKKN